MLNRRHPISFRPDNATPYDGNAKARIQAYAHGYNALHREGRQHRGPLTRATLEVLAALLWGFHNSRTGLCFPSYEAIADRAKCCRDTAIEAVKALEAAGILSWINRIVRRGSEMLRTSNSYRFHDPGGAKSEIPARTPIQDSDSFLSAAPKRAGAGLEAALARLGARLRPHPPESDP